MPRDFKKDQFFSLYTQGFVRVGVATPRVFLAEPQKNMATMLPLIEEADQQGAALLLFPELSLTGYSLDDLFLQEALHQGVQDALLALLEATRAKTTLVVVGLPVVYGNRLYNAAAILHKGRILGIVPKTYLPNYREFYEARHFASGAAITGGSLTLAGQNVPFGVDLLFAAEDFSAFTFGIEICEDVWVPIPPSSRQMMAGARVICNLSASNALVGKSEARHQLAASQSARGYAAYLYSAAGYGESTTDLAWDGQGMIYENGVLLAQSPRFSLESGVIFADIDLETLTSERVRHGSFEDCARLNSPSSPFRICGFRLEPKEGDLGLRRAVARFPYVPSDAKRLDDLCEEAFAIQSQGLARRLEASGLKKIVLGVSGGLDSSHALLVGVQALALLGLPRSHLLAYTLPAFATSERTKSSAWRLMEALGVQAQEIDLSPACMHMLRDIKHPAGEKAALYDITYENVQAGARTSLLFRLANFHDALVLGTGDLSELALGWCTYGVGDHMSHYNVNSSVSKTLIQHLMRWVARKNIYGEAASDVLETILATQISPELIPGSGEEPAQKTEDKVGPYALQDFNLFHITRYGMRPSKVAFLAWHAWHDQKKGEWPPHHPPAQRVSYDLETIRFWLASFLYRFFQTSQFKRSALPNGPKISSGGSLSPRGDWRAPSDSSAALWLAELENALPLTKT